MKTLRHLLSFALATGGAVSLLLLSTPSTEAAATVRHWTGASGTNWSTAANWSNNVAPVAGDILIFQASALRKTNWNNFAAGTTFSDLRLTGDYIIEGNRVTLTNRITLTAQLVGPNSASVGMPLTINNDVTITSGATIVGRATLNLRGSIALNLASGEKLTFGGGGNSIVLGAITGTGYLNHSGSGLLHLAANGSFAGFISEDGGTLRLDGQFANAWAYVSSSMVGTGTVAILDAFFGSRLSPGNGPGRFTVRQDLSYYDSPTLVMELNGTNAGVSYDQLVVQGQIFNGDFGTYYVELDLGYQARPGDRFKLIDNQGASFAPFFTIAGTQCPGTVVVTNGVIFHVTTSGGDGNDLEAQVVATTNEPVKLWGHTGNAPTYWSIATNWHGGVAPALDDHLVFSDLSCGIVILTNDLPAGRRFASLSFIDYQTPGNYTLRGNRIQVTSGLTNAALGLESRISLPVELVGAVAVDARGAGLFVFNEAISGSGGLTKSGTNTLILLSASPNSYTGGTVINEGTLTAQKPTIAIPGPLTIGDGVGTDTMATGIFPDQFPALIAVTINSSGVLDLLNTDQAVGSLTLNGGRVQGIANSSTLKLGGNLLANASPAQATLATRINLQTALIGFNVADGPLDEDVAITGVITNGSLTKLGAGTLLLTATNRHTVTTVSAGRLRVTGSLAAGITTVNGGTLDGTGLLGLTTVTSGTMAPGTNGPGLLRVSGNLTLGASATFAVKLNGLIAGSTYDQLSVTGTVNLANATLTVTPGFVAVPGQSFLILLNDGADAITGTFAGLPQGAIFLASGQAFSISYTGGTGNDVMLTRVPTPSTLGGLTRLGNGQFQFQGAGEQGLTYTILANTNLNTPNWLPIGTAPANGAGQFQFLDTNAPQHPRRFYRAVAP